MDNSEEVELRDSSTNTDSDRVLVTKRAIFQAFVALVDERDFSSISAGDIMERAGVSRSTFYRCFADKYDIVNWSYKRYKNIRVQDRDQHYAFDTGMKSQLLHLRDYRTFYAAALRYLGQNSLRDSMYETNEEYMLECWQAEHGSHDVSGDVRATIQFAAGGMVKIVELWVLDGCVQDPDDVIRIIEACIPPAILETLF